MVFAVLGHEHEGDTVENIENKAEETLEPSVEELEMEWWQPLSCGCDPASED